MRAFVIVLDGVGAGATPDAAAYGDEDADTLGHLLDAVGTLELPALWSLGLGRVLGRGDGTSVQASYGRMRERSAGKDSQVGHWELAGAVIDTPFAVFERFPPALVGAIEAEAGVKLLGNVPASGTAIIAELGAEHLRTGSPILYTSADSVLQIAAHEERIAPERLYEICRIARRLADPFRVGRVIARPFIGEPGAFVRTPRRHDFSMRPPPTVLDALRRSHVPVIGIGKISDLFAGEGIDVSHPTESNRGGMTAIDAAWADTDHGLVLANLVDFDTSYGHRRDVAGFARALGELDGWLAGFLDRLAGDDLLVITADHGNDPTFKGTDHTREHAPLLVRHAGARRDLGCRESFTDVAATLSDYFRLPQGWPAGASAL